ALTEDGTLTAFDAAGKIAWQQSFDAGETLTWDAGERLIVVGATHSVVALDRAGKTLFKTAAPSVTCVAAAPDGASAAYGTADGKLTLCDAAGKTTAAVAGGDAKNPRPYLAAMFAADGKSIVALTAQEAHVIVDGKIAQRIGGVAGRVAPVRDGASILLSDGNEKVLVVADGKVSATIPIAKAGVVALSGCAVGTEMDGGVRFVKDGKVAWEHKAVRRLTKRVAANGSRVDVAYWGGSIAILEAGAVKAAQAFPSDVAEIAWSGDR